MIYVLLYTPSLTPQSCLGAGYFLGVCGAALRRVTRERWESRKCVSLDCGTGLFAIKSKGSCWVALWFCQPSLLKWINSVFKLLIKLAGLLVFVAWTPDSVKQHSKWRHCLDPGGPTVGQNRNLPPSQELWSCSATSSPLACASLGHVSLMFSWAEQLNRLCLGTASIRAEKSLV